MQSPRADSLFGTSISRNISPRNMLDPRDDPEEHAKRSKETDEEVNRYDSQIRSYQPEDLASSKWKMKKFLPRNEISHDSIQFMVAAEDGTARTYKRYRNSKMNQSVDFPNSSSHNILLEPRTRTDGRHKMFDDEESHSRSRQPLDIVGDEQRNSVAVQGDRAANRKFLKQFRADLTNIDSPVKGYKQKQRIYKHSPFQLKDYVATPEKPSMGLFKADKGDNIYSLGNQQKSVIERVRLSQKMAEQRENKLKTFIDGRRDLNVDDGDHGVSQGFLKRKGLNQYSSHLHSLLRDSSSRPFMPVDIDGADVAVGLSASEVPLKGAPTTMKNIHSASFDFVDERRPAQGHRSVLDSAKADPQQAPPASYDQYPIPPSGYKKIELPKVRDRDRYLITNKIQLQNQNVNKSFRRYLN